MVIDRRFARQSSDLVLSNSLAYRLSLGWSCDEYSRADNLLLVGFVLHLARLRDEGLWGRSEYADRRKELAWEVYSISLTW